MLFHHEMNNQMQYKGFIIILLIMSNNQTKSNLSQGILQYENISVQLSYALLCMFVDI